MDEQARTKGRSLVLVVGLLLWLPASAPGCAAGSGGDGDSDVDSDGDGDGDVDSDSDGEDSDGDGDGEPATPGFTQVAIALPDDFPEVDGFGLFDVAIGSTRRWVTAFTTIVPEPGWASNGPVAIFERHGEGAFAGASVPDSRMVFLPDLCVVGDEEVYVTFVDTRPDERVVGRVFARQAGPEPVFVEQPAPEAAPGRSVMSMRSVCFSGGALWVFGSTQVGDDLYSNVPFVFHRAGTSEPWEPVALPEAVTAPTWGVGTTSLLIDRDGTGLYAFSSGDLVSLFSRSSDGSWVEVYEATSGQVAQVLDLTAGGDGLDGLAGTQSGSEQETGGYLRLGPGSVTLEEVPETSELWAAARDSAGRLFLAGCLYSETESGLTATTALVQPDRTAVLPPRDGRIQAIALPTEGRGPGLAIVDFTADPAETGLYEVALPW